MYLENEWMNLSIFTLLEITKVACEDKWIKMKRNLKNTASSHIQTKLFI